jgi:propionyl-CoA carboxylase beta chain
MTDQKRALLEEQHRLAENGGGADRVARQHAEGKMTARERLTTLLDQGSFEELDKLVQHRCQDFGMPNQQFPGDGIITGRGQIGGRPVFVFAQDFTVFGGSLSETNAQKICKLMDLAMKLGIPVIGLNDSGGARIQEGVASLAGYAEIFMRNTLASGVIPQISAIMGPCAGGAVYSPAITDFVLMVRGSSHMFITGPEVIRTVTHEEVTKEALGGAVTHNETSGVAHFLADNDEECLELIRQLFAYLPLNNLEDPPRIASTDPIDRADERLETIVPSVSNQPYDIRQLIELVVDHGEFLETQPLFARNIVTGFARLDGQPIGIVANQPAFLAGVLDIDASTKAARFVRFCDCFNIPIITLVDVPGFLPGVEQEHAGIIRHGAKLLYAYAEATVPKITLVTRKAYGGAYCVMGSKQVRTDLNFAYPTAEIAVMGPEGAVDILYRRELAADPDRTARRQQWIKEYQEKFASPLIAAQRGYLDEVIEPRMTRLKLIRGLQLLANKRESNPPRKHGNLPL